MGLLLVLCLFELVEVAAESSLIEGYKTERELTLICKLGDKSRGNRLAGCSFTRKYVQGMNTLYGCAYIKIIYVNIITMLWQGRGGRGKGAGVGQADRRRLFGWNKAVKNCQLAH